MSRKTFIWLIIGATLILVGAIIIGGLMYKLDWDFSKLSSSELQEVSYEFEGEITDISVSIDTEDISFLPSDNGKTKVVCYESEGIGHHVTLEGTTLKISSNDTRKWYNFAFNFGKSRIAVYLPETTYASLSLRADTSNVSLPPNLYFSSVDVSSYSKSLSTKITSSTGDVILLGTESQTLEISTSTGDVSITGAKHESVSIRVSTGDVKLTDLTCANFVTKGSTGELSLTRVIASGIFSIERSTGDVSFDSCDAAEIYVVTDTGDVKGSFASDKFFHAETSTGDVNVPKFTSGGICEIKTGTGDISITVNN